MSASQSSPPSSNEDFRRIASTRAHVVILQSGL